MRFTHSLFTLAALAGGLLLSRPAAGQENLTSFTHQGRLVQAGQPVDGLADLRFTLFDAPAGGLQVGQSVDLFGVDIRDGLFAVPLDFGGNAFNPLAIEDGRWVEVAVRTLQTGGGFVTLSPRQQITGAPYSLSTRGMRVDAGDHVSFGDLVAESGVRVRVGALGSDQTALRVHHPGPNLADLLMITVPEDHDGVASFIKCVRGNEFTGDRFSVFGSGAVRIVSDVETALRIQRNTSTSGPAAISLRGSTGLESVIKAVGGAGLRIDPGHARLGIRVDPQHPIDVRHPPISHFTWPIRITNDIQTVFETGMRVTDDGFFEVTNKIDGPANFARLSTTGNWTSVSDERRKAEIVELGPVLERALALRPVTYRYKGADGRAAGERQLGLIAQQVRPLFPSLVSEGDGLLTLDYSTLSTVAIAAIQEQQGQIEAQSQMIACLRAENAELRSEVSDLSERTAELERRLERMERSLAASRFGSSAGERRD